MTKVYIHVHRADRPGKCYWVSQVSDDPALYGLSPSIFHAEEVAMSEVNGIAMQIALQFETYIECFTAKCEDPDLVPSHIRSLVGL